MKTLLVLASLVAFGASAEIKLGDWHVVGPFKDEEFGNLDRSLEYVFEPEADYMRALGIPTQVEKPQNLALKATASSPDAMPVQGANPPAHAIDGNSDSYWDDADGGKEYILQLDWKKPVKMGVVVLSGWKRHDHAPKSFALHADGHVVAEVTDAQYSSNRLEVEFDPVVASKLELKVSASYGWSPAVREIEVFEEFQSYEAKEIDFAIDVDASYEMLPFPGYLDLERRWDQRSDYSDGFYNVLPRGPAPSRMEVVYLYRTIESDKDQTVNMHFRLQDFYRVWMNGEAVFTCNWLHGNSRYPRGDKRTVKLKKGTNHLLIKAISRWAEHGFAFAIEGMHNVKDPFFVDVNSMDALSDDQYVSAFKFNAEPIPMHSPEKFEIEESLASFPATPSAAAYDQKLKAFEQEVETTTDASTMRKKLEGFLDSEVRKLPPLVFITKPLHNQNAIAPYRTRGSTPSAIYKLDPSKPGSEAELVFAQPDMRIYDMSLSFDGKTIFFSAKKTNKDYAWNIYEIGVDGTGLKQITEGDTADISPIELPGGRIAFISTRRKTFVECQSQYAGLLFTMNRDGSDMKLISANIDSDHSPRVTNDGRIMFTRWDYGVEKNVFARHALWTVNPDGTNFQLVFGNTIEDPGGFWWAHTIPDRPEILAVFGPHHNHHAGMIGLIWNGKGPETKRGTGYRWVTREVPCYGDLKYPDGYRTPWPLNEKQFLVSYGGMKHRPEWDNPEKIPAWRRPENTMTPLKLLYLDAYGNERIIYEAPDGLSVWNAIPVQARKVPPVIADKIPPFDWTFQDPETMNRTDAGTGMMATMMVQDVYKGISDHVKPGEAKYIAVMEQVQKSRILSGGEAWGHSPLIGRGTVHVRRLNGLVPIEEDGSAFFKVPALRSVSINVLNEEGKTLMRMGADLHVMPNEKLSCIGCHEQREFGYGSAPPMSGKTPMALRKAPVEPQKRGWGTQGLIDYVSVVQPVWDKHCVECHSGPLAKGGVNMTDDKTRFFNQSYDHLIDRDIVDHLSVFSLDHDEGTPNTVGAMVSRIDEFMSPEHCGSEISWEEKFRVYCWIDANVPYYATYDAALVDMKPRGLGMRDTWFENKKGADPWAQETIPTVFEKRCADCHERDALNMSWLIPKRMKVHSDIWGDKALSSHGLGAKWHLAAKFGPEFRVNMTNPSHSLLLQAPLSEDAGGAGMCENEDGSPVFKDKGDPDYQTILKAIQRGHGLLYKDPRIDMLGKEAFMNPLPGCSAANLPEGPGGCGEDIVP